METPVISYALASQNPEALADFYRFVIDGNISDQKGLDHFELSSLHRGKIHVYRPSSKGAAQTLFKTAALCFEMPSSSDPLLALKEITTELLAKGAHSLETPRMDSFGAELWLEDPDGNNFLLFVPAEK